ncbi:hypothetical protein ACFWZ2_21445 [Streptomyces sp. NPDC059002]|uniref:hypothetical protein n=1 Tax=Streptomyces sp. NPDC059002 TaxID=3346690 RepID=UPI0036AE73A1
MTRSTRLVAAALTASAALLLTACGGSDDSKDNDKIAGADTGSEKSASSSPSVSADGAKRPEIKLPKTFQANFEGWTNSDPKLQAILDDGKGRLRAGYAAIMAGDPQFSAMKFYTTGTARKSGAEWVKTYKDLTLKGSVRVFNPQVHVSNEGFGVLFYCVDEAKGYTRNLKTGKVAGTPEGENPKIQYRTRLDRNAQGVWQTSTVETDEGGCGR